MRIAVLGLVALVLSGCVSAQHAKTMPDDALISRYVMDRQFGGLDLTPMEDEIKARKLFTDDEWARVKDNHLNMTRTGGNFRVGDRKQFVQASAGEPRNFGSRQDANGLLEVWEYDGGGIGFRGSVVFRNDRIVSIYR